MTAPWQPTEADLVGLVYREARLLDAKAYDEWYELFAADGRYWVPMSATQIDPQGEQSIAYEDKLLLRIRIERLRGPRTYSERPPTVSQHVLQVPELIEHAAQENRFMLRTPFIYVEARGTDQLVLAGTARHRVRIEDAALRVVEKRIDLLNASAPLPAIRLFL